MKSSKKIQKKHTSVIIDKRLGKLAKVILFPKKVEDANRMLKEVGLPADLK